MLWPDVLTSYFKSLDLPTLPAGYGCINPYSDPERMAIVEKFFRTYYNDRNQRIIMLGINPGRFGAGQTGIPFTDPVRLEKDLGIKNPYDKREELSSTFFYDMVRTYGGTEKFYAKFLVDSVYPLGFVKDSKNVNYYDLPNVNEFMAENVVPSLNARMGWNINRSVAYCIGSGDNVRALERLNQHHHWFAQIRPMFHPVWIMKYHRADADQYITGYMSELAST